MIYFVDIDKTICDKEDGLPYSAAQPIIENINKINALYYGGHTIVYWTARGASTGDEHNLFDITMEQLNEWGAEFDEIRMGKPYYDVIIDDKALRIEEVYE